MKDEHVILTTMSTIPSGNRLTTNYYFDGETGLTANRPAYTDGILQTEAGSKYFLSRYPIDRIVVIGSDKTYDISPDCKDILNKSHTDNLAEELDSYNHQSASKYSYWYYKYRIAQFIRDKNYELEYPSSTIEDSRKRELNKIAEDFVRANALSDIHYAFHEITRSSREGIRTLSNDLRKKIEEDISKDFLPKESLDDLALPIEEYPQLKRLENELSKISDSRELIYKNLDDSISDLELDPSNNFTLLEQNNYLQAVRIYINRAISDLEIEALTKKVSAYREVILRLRIALDSVMAELQALKSNRLNTEFNYIKSYLYSELEETYKLKCKAANKTISLQFVPSARGNSDQSLYNLSGIISAIRGSNPDTHIHLYVDSQGGFRSDEYVRNAVLSVLNNESSSKFTLEEIVITDFEARNFAHAILNVKKRYDVIDLASGMNAFTSYGRTELITTYSASRIKANSRTGKLIAAMQDVDHALSICNVGNLEKAIKKLRKVFKSTEEIANTEEEEIFSVLENSIRRDFSTIIATDKIDFGVLADWAFGKNFLQQTLTIIEAKFPYEFVEKGIIFYLRSDNLAKDRYDTTNKLKNKYNNTDIKKYEFKDIDHFIIKFAAQGMTSNKTKYSPCSIDKNNLKYYKLNKKNMNANSQVLNIALYTYVPSRKQLQTLLKCYFDLRVARNLIAHSSENSEYSFMSNEHTLTYTHVRNDVSTFLNLYCQVVESLPEGICVEHLSLPESDLKN